MKRSSDSLIFVSYSNIDSHFVHPEIERLESQGYRIWYDKGDQLQPSQPWADDISRAIKECSCFIVFITQHAVESENVRIEIAQGLEARKPFICIYWEKVELPPEFREPIKKIQALERYSFSSREHQYERPLDLALSKYVAKTGPRKGRGYLQQSGPPATIIRYEWLPKLAVIGLLLLGVICIFLVAAGFVSPYLSKMPGDPFGVPWVGVLVGSLFLFMALALGGGALANKEAPERTKFYDRSFRSSLIRHRPHELNPFLTLSLVYL
jgi:hypothetical protein